MTGRRRVSRRTVGWSVAGLVLVAGAAAVGAQMVMQARAPLPGPARAAPQEAASPVPVLLVPGWRDDAEQLTPLRNRFLAAGWPDSAVVALSFEDPVGSNRAHARTVALAVEALQDATGAARVDVVAHSMGGLAVRYYLQHGGGEDVRRVAFLATPHRGTLAAYMAWGDGGQEMSPGSDFLLALNKGLGALPAGVEGITVRTPVDFHILPPESATLPLLPDIEVCCPTHWGLLDDAEVFRVVERFLRREP